MLDRIPSVLSQQRSFFSTGQTQDIEFRLSQLRRLQQIIRERQDDILQALQADLHKPAYEAMMTELVVLQEIEHTLKHVRSWAKPKSVPATLLQMPARGKIYPEPLGVVLIIGAWNYPFYLTIAPLIAAIAAGNCAIVKPSELAPHTSRIVAELIEKTFDPAYVKVIEGGIETSQALLAEKFDHIFFTGSPAVGKVVMAAAAQHLTPVTLELGGKSPCIVDQAVDLDIAARRIAWGKFLNAGQTCIAPDYVLVDRHIQPAFLSALKNQIQQLYPNGTAETSDYARLISDRHFVRVVELIQPDRILIGGETDAASRYIAPTVVTAAWDDPVMQTEIFAPVLPILEYNTLTEAIEQINQRPKPLALYVFSQNRQVCDRVVRETSSGGVCINDTILHIAPPHLPFGGVGNSGMGQYHGKAGFDTFSHYKSVLARPFWLELPIRYPPYSGKVKRWSWLFK